MRKQFAQMGKAGLYRPGNVFAAQLMRLSNVPVDNNLRRRFEGYMRIHCLFFRIARHHRRRQYM